MADAADSKSAGGDPVRVQVPPSAFTDYVIKLLIVNQINLQYNQFGIIKRYFTAMI